MPKKDQLHGHFRTYRSYEGSDTRYNGYAVIRMILSIHLFCASG